MSLPEWLFPPFGIATHLISQKKISQVLVQGQPHILTGEQQLFHSFASFVLSPREGLERTATRESKTPKSPQTTWVRRVRTVRLWYQWYFFGSIRFNEHQRVCSEVFRPKPDLTIQYSPSWGSYLVTCVDGELSKDYLVKDRRAPSCQLECGTLGTIDSDRRVFLWTSKCKVWSLLGCWSGLTKTSLCWKTAALSRRKINFLWRFGGRRAASVQATTFVYRELDSAQASCKQVDYLQTQLLPVLQCPCSAPGGWRGSVFCRKG